MTRDEQYKVNMFSEIVARNECLHKEVDRLLKQVEGLEQELLSLCHVLNHDRDVLLGKSKLDKSNQG